MNGQFMRRGVVISCGISSICPTSERVQQLSIDEISHIHGAGRLMIFDVVYLVEEFAAVRFRYAGIPRFIPRTRGVLQSLVAVLANILGDAYGPIEC